jgi:hypothetical protein
MGELDRAHTQTVAPMEMSSRIYLDDNIITAQYTFKNKSVMLFKLPAEGTLLRKR